MVAEQIPASEGAPLMIEVWRGELVESVHRVHAAVCTAEGTLLRAWGDAERVAYPRSSLKPLQAFPLVESGAAEAFGLTDRELAVVCGSHGAEPFHLEAVASILARAGLDEAALQCGAHRPAYLPEADKLVRAGEEPRCIHNNCSGKHSGMLTLTRHLGGDPARYLELDQPAQRAIVAGLARLSGTPAEAIHAGLDGCSAPTFALPIRGAATAFARLAAGATGSATGDAAARRIAGAMMAHPEMVAGTGRFDTLLMRVLAGEIFCKGGAEGFFCIGLPGRGLGIALKVEDGAGRGTAPAALAVLGAVGALPDPLPGELEASARPPVTNAAGRVVGVIAPAKRG